MLTVSRYEALGAEHAAAYSQIREHCEVPQQRNRCNCQRAIDSEQAGLR